VGGVAARERRGCRMSLRAPMQHCVRSPGEARRSILAPSMLTGLRECWVFQVPARWPMAPGNGSGLQPTDGATRRLAAPVTTLGQLLPDACVAVGEAVHGPAVSKSDKVERKSSTGSQRGQGRDTDQVTTCGNADARLSGLNGPGLFHGSRGRSPAAAHRSRCSFALAHSPRPHPCHATLRS
jgi:hypothetical protein